MASEIEAAGGGDSDLAYEQVAADIGRRIKLGELKPGSRLLSERALAEFYGRSYGTVRKAMEVLRERGLVRTVHGRGNFVVRG